MVVHNYDSLWRIKKKLYSIERIKLPFSVEYAQIAYYFVGLVLVTMVFSLVGLHNVNLLMQYGLLPCLFAWGMSRVKLDGKGLHRFMLALLMYMVSSHHLNRYQPVKQHGKCRYHWTVWKVGVSGDEKRETVKGKTACECFKT